MLALVLIAQLTSVSAPQLKALTRPAKRPLVVHAWASWCMPCVAELPELVAGLRKRSADVLWVNVDSEPQKAARILKRLGRLPGRAVWAAADALAGLRALDEKWDGELPATWLVATDGSLLLSQRGLSDLDDLWTHLDQTGRGP